MGKSKGCEEVWKDIPGYEGLYQVSNLGRVKTLHKVFGKPISEKGMVMKQFFCKGYLNIKLCKDRKYRQFQVHRLVAMAFIPNPDNLPFVNHIDENGVNNISQNLEWCTHSYNINYGTRNKKVSKKLSVNILQLSLTGNVIREFASLHEAANITGVDISHICNVCKGIRNKAGGYKWKYAQNH